MGFAVALEDTADGHPRTTLDLIIEIEKWSIKTSG